MVACVVAQKVEWLKKACIAAALLLPAVAAIHGIVLAALHNNGELQQLGVCAAITGMATHYCRCR